MAEISCHLVAAAAVAEAVPEAARSLAVASHLANDNIDKFELFKGGGHFRA